VVVVLPAEEPGSEVCVVWSVVGGGVPFEGPSASLSPHPTTRSASRAPVASHRANRAFTESPHTNVPFWPFSTYSTRTLDGVNDGRNLTPGVGEFKGVSQRLGNEELRWD
jgi:hypothetical protein